MTGEKDSEEVARFLTLFAKVKECCNDLPDELAAASKDNASVKGLCVDLCLVAYELRRHERRRRELFSAPVNPAFQGAWRDFEGRFDWAVTDIWLDGLLSMASTTESGKAPRGELRWQSADSDAVEQARAIEEAISFAYDQASDDHRGFSDEFREAIEEGSASWDRLRIDAGFDLRGVFRRRELVPFVLVPKHVSQKYGDSDAYSLLKSLQQAHEAFVFGVPLAALALMRSILEAVLRDHYGAEGKNLDQRIRNAATNLPAGASQAALDRLRKMANAILHLDVANAREFPRIDEGKLEREIVSLLLVLRALIEGVPERRNAGQQAGAIALERL